MHSHSAHTSKINVMAFRDVWGDHVRNLLLVTSRPHLHTLYKCAYFLNVKIKVLQVYYNIQVVPFLEDEISVVLLLTLVRGRMLVLWY